MTDEMKQLVTIQEKVLLLGKQRSSLQVVEAAASDNELVLDDFVLIFHYEILYPQLCLWLKQISYSFLWGDALLAL